MTKLCWYKTQNDYCKNYCLKGSNACRLHKNKEVNYNYYVNSFMNMLILMIMSIYLYQNYMELNEDPLKKYYNNWESLIDSFTIKV